MRHCCCRCHRDNDQAQCKQRSNDGSNNAHNQDASADGSAPSTHGSVRVEAMLLERPDRDDGRSAMVRLQSEWLPALATYLAFISGLHLAWEAVQLPLYTIWTTGTLGEQVFAVVHCTGGDLIIALSSLVAALLLTWAVGWPRQHFWRVAMVTIVIGVTYTAFSEWLNVYVRKSWAYSDWMPTLTVGTVRIGLSPLMQWLLVPTLAFLAVGAVVRGRLPSGH